MRNQDGRPRFEWRERRALFQRSVLDPPKEWRIKLAKDTVDPAHPDYNAKAARAKLRSRRGTVHGLGPGC